MGQFLRCARASALAVCAATMAMFGAPGIETASAKTKAKPAAAAAAPQDEAAQKQKDSAAAHASYDAGVKSYQGGKFEPAVQSFTAALRGGGLPASDMAHALYYRGLAYKKQSKPGLAISDLTSALWLKNGLSDSERASATSERADAYRLAGLGDGNTGSDQVSVADPNVAASAPAKTAAPANTTVPQSPSASVSTAPATRKSEDQASLQTAALGSEPQTLAAAQAAPRAPVSKPAVRDATIAELQSAGYGERGQKNLAFPEAPPVSVAQTGQPAVNVPVPIPTTTPALSVAPVENAAAATSQTSAAVSNVPKAITGFFANMFGGSPAPAAPSSTATPVTTASTSAAAPTAANWQVAAPAPAGQAIKAGPAKAAQQVAAAAPVADPQAAPQIKGGKYKIHIAALRSRAEADALAQKLVQQQGAHLMSRTPVVDEAEIGSMGTFYRVRVGSFATAEEPRGLCNTLRTGGFDCLVVTN